MQERNVDFEIPLTRDQWDQLGRRAADLGPGDGGFGWQEQDPERIHVYLRDEDATGVWERYVSGEETYGGSEREVAQFVFNGGRPFARLEPPSTAEKPAITDAEEQGMEVGLERWVRGKWDVLMRESGLHYDRGHIPES